MGHYTNAQGTVAGFDSTTGAKGVGYHGADNSGGAVKTQSGDIYAGRDGNVYKKTDTGWSKYSDGGWTPINPQQNLKSGTQPVNSESQSSRAGTRSQQSAQPSDTVSRQTPTRSTSAPSSSSYQRGESNWGSTREQLDHDFSARTMGEGRTQDYSSWRDRFQSSAGERQGGGLLGGERPGAESFGGERQRFGVGRGGGWGRR